MKIHAEYVSIWDGGTEIRSSCIFDPVNKTVENIQTVDYEGDSCDDEFVEWYEDGEYLILHVDEFINLDIGETWDDKE
jgi:hypothetical protein